MLEACRCRCFSDFRCGELTTALTPQAMSCLRCGVAMHKLYTTTSAATARAIRMIVRRRSEGHDRPGRAQRT